MENAASLGKILSMSANGLKAARKRIGLTQEQVAERIGVSSPQISRWESGKDGIPSQRVPAILAAYEAGVADIYGDGSGLDDVASLETNGRAMYFEGASDVVLSRDVPIFGTTLGAPLDFNGDAIEQTMLNSGETIGYLPRPTILNGKKGVYGLYVQGSSMSPRFDDGDTIFVQDSQQGQPPRIGDDVVVYLRDVDDDDGRRASAVLVKRLIRRTASHVELEQFSPAARFKIESAKIVRIDRVIPWRELLS